MARMTKEQAWDKHSKFSEAMRNPEFRKMSRKEQAEFLEITPTTLYTWIADLKDDDWVEINKEIDKKTAKVEIEIKDALAERAKVDTKSAEFWFELVKGWSRKNINENINKNADLDGMTLEEKKAEALKLYTPEELAKALAEKKAPSQVVMPDKAEGNG